MGRTGRRMSLLGPMPGTGVGVDTWTAGARGDCVDAGCGEEVLLVRALVDCA